MKTTIKNDMTTSEARDTVVITEEEARAISQLVNSLDSQTSALKALLSASGIESWIGSNHPRSLANMNIRISDD